MSMCFFVTTRFDILVLRLIFTFLLNQGTFPPAKVSRFICIHTRHIMSRGVLMQAAVCCACE